jgi:diguanylate cyclase (GGDEF)-like protein
MPSGKLFRRVLVYEYLGFGIMLFLLWLNEMLDIPHKFFGNEATPINYTESMFESIILLTLAFCVIRSTMLLLNRIEELAMFDPLTKLMNRGFLKEFLQREVNRSSRSRRPFSIIMGDVDHFKWVNDQHGHDCGDRMLEHLARILRKNLRSEDVICRWGGEEFLFLLPETDLEEAGDVAEKLRHKIEKSPLSFKDMEISVTMSFGVTTHTPGDRNTSSCINAADRRLYEAKKQGRNQVVPNAGQQTEPLFATEET